jgi:uncharacterized GH25 family protein
MKKKYAQIICLLMSLLCFSSIATAHDYWILPSTFQPASGDIIDAAFTSAHSYFETEETPDVAKYAMGLRTPSGDDLALAYSRVSPRAAWVRFPVSQPGTYVISAVNTTPEYWTQTTQGWQAGKGEPQSGLLKTSKYTKSMKTFLTVGEPSDTYKAILGFGIEMVPQANPTALKKGDHLPVQVLFGGDPLPNVPVMAIYEGYKAKDHADQPVQTLTDDSGVARIKIDRPGKWVVFARHEFPTDDIPGKSFENHRPYIMFDVR